MDSGLGGKTAMVSGASKGIGRAVAEKLAAEGVRLSLCARGADQLRAVARELEDKHGAACLAYPADLSRAEDIQGWVRVPLKRPGTADEVANLVVFLASELSTYITGTTIAIDGGMTRTI